MVCKSSSQEVKVIHLGLRASRDQEKKKSSKVCISLKLQEHLRSLRRLSFSGKEKRKKKKNRPGVTSTTGPPRSRHHCKTQVPKVQKKCESGSITGPGSSFQGGKEINKSNPGSAAREPPSAKPRGRATHARPFRLEPPSPGGWERPGPGFHPSPGIRGLPSPAALLSAPAAAAPTRSIPPYSPAPNSWTRAAHGGSHRERPGPDRPESLRTRQQPEEQQPPRPRPPLPHRAGPTAAATRAAAPMPGPKRRPAADPRPGGPRGEGDAGLPLTTDCARPPRAR